LTGYVRNLDVHDAVEVVVAGGDGQLERYLSRLRRGPLAALVREMTVERVQGETTYLEFAIRY